MNRHDDACAQSLISAARAIADDHRLTAHLAWSETSGLVLQSPEQSVTPATVSALRGQFDRLALIQRFHEPGLHARLRACAGNAMPLFDIAERVRIQALGARRWPGVARNLSTLLEQELGEERDAPDDADAANALSLLLWEALGGEKLQGVSALRLAWESRFWRSFGGELDELRRTLHDQAGFAKCLLRALRRLQESGRAGREDGEADEDDAREEVDPAPDDRSLDADADPQERDARTRLDVAPADDGAVLLPGAKPPNGCGEAVGSYRAYTTEYDEVSRASALCGPAEREQLRVRLDERLAQVYGLIGRLAHRFQRMLMAEQARRWEFDLDEGQLDGARLTRIVTNPGLPPSYKKERESAFRDTVVSLLVDNSGSMKGRPIEVAAVTADVLSRTMERCGVKVEVLGFTTRTWKGGRSHEQWLYSGKPRRPGRLNELRHIVYKDADTPYRRARQDLAVMLMDQLLKENIDGEAIEWACQRLLARREPRRVLVVISDGAPADDCTAVANGGAYLDDHLHQVIRRVEQTLPIDLFAIGIAHDVASYYRRAVRVDDVDELGGALVDQLSELLKGARASCARPHEGSFRSTPARRPGRPARRSPPATALF